MYVYGVVEECGKVHWINKVCTHLVCLLYIEMYEFVDGLPLDLLVSLRRVSTFFTHALNKILGI